MVRSDEFLQAIFGDDVPDNEAILVSKGRKSDGAPTFHIRITHHAYLDWHPKTERARLQFFFAPATTIDNGEERLSHRAVDAQAAYCVVLDDIGTKCKEPPVEPSWRLESSPGNFQYGYILEPTENLEAVAGFLQKISELNFTDPACTNPEHLFRLPGAYHVRKKFRAAVTTWNPERFWAVEELAGAFEVDPTFHVKRAKRAGKASLGGARTLDVIDDVVGWLEEENLIIRDEPTAGHMTIECPWAGEHSDNRNEAFYYPLGRGDDEWVERRGFHCFHEHCAGRKYAEFKEWMVGQGGPDLSGYDPLPWLQSRYVFVTEGSQVIDLLSIEKNVSPYEFPITDWANENYRKVSLPGHDKPVILKTAFVADERTTRARRTLYRPGADRVVSQADGTKAVNVYAHPNHEVLEGQPEVFLRHTQRILRIKEERELFYNWLAYKLQHPASRSYAVIMVASGTYGVGRSWVTDMLAGVFGRNNVKPASIKNLLGTGNDQWGGWGSEAQLVTIEEGKGIISRDDFWDSYEHVKEIIDTRPVYIRVNPKYGQVKLEEMYFNVLLNSNNPDAFMLPSGDRRFAVLTNTEEKESDAYYKTLWAAREAGEATLLYQWLMARDVSQYNHITPPMTPAKEIMINLSKGPRDKATDLLLAALAGDVVTKTQLDGISADVMKTNALSDKELQIYRHSADKIWQGGLQLKDKAGQSRRFRVRGEREYVRCIRNHHSWRSIDDAEIIKREVMKNERVPAQPKLVRK